MKLPYLLLVLVILVSCNHPGLNEKQREQLKQGKADRAIRKITEAEILEVAKLKGETLVNSLSAPTDELKTHQAFWLSDSGKTDNMKFREIREAYSYSAQQGANLPSYVEIDDNDSLLFAKPMTYNNIHGIWFVYLNKRQIIRTIGQ